MNLIINARDAMPDGGTIRIRVDHRTTTGKDQPGLKPGDYVVFAVEDHGSGIAPEMIEKVMEPFFTTKEVGKGTGLGLSMVYGFARQSNGAIALESEVGKGTQAELWLPRAETAPVKQEIRPVGIQVSAAKLNILLVDDHDEVRAATAGMFQDLGHNVMQASNGAEALELLTRNGIDLLVSDYAMPQLSGTDLVRGARSRRPDLTAMIITGYADQDDIGDLPADVVVLSKPFDLAALSAAVLKATKDHASSAS